jgi:uncharacterized damage-inducible protein DinB
LLDDPSGFAKERRRIVIKQAFDGARELWRSARQTGVWQALWRTHRYCSPFTTPEAYGCCLFSYRGICRFAPAVQAMTCSLHSLFLLHRFFEALLEDRLEKEIRAMTTGLSDFFQYNLWANLRLLDACAQLSDAQLDATMNGTFGSVRETLMHLFASEEGYARSVTGNIPTTPQLRELTWLPDFDELRRRAKRTGEDLIRFVEQAEQADLNKILHLDRGTYDAPVIVVVIQAINHAIDHRSQIATLLSQQDIEPPDLDSWAYNDTMRERL